MVFLRFPFGFLRVFHGFPGVFLWFSKLHKATSSYTICPAAIFVQVCPGASTFISARRATNTPNMSNRQMICANPYILPISGAPAELIRWRSAKRASSNGLGEAWGRLRECLGNASWRLGEAWGGLFHPRSASLGRLGEAWGMLGNASGRLGEAWASLGLSQPAERMLLEHFFGVLCYGPASQPAKRMTGLFYPRSFSHGIARDALGWRVHASASLESPQTRWLAMPCQCTESPS